MMRRWTRVMGAALVTVLLGTAAGAEVYVYPKKGQSQEQFEQDQFACHKWATGQTGVDPSQPMAAAAAPPPASGGVVRGGARGAALGAIGGAIGGNAAKGAAIGAGVGAAAGGMRQGAYNKAAAQQASQAQAQQQTGLQNYERAYAACMGGRGYTVK